MARTPKRTRKPVRANVTGIDAYAPTEIAALIEKAGVAKAKMPLDKLLMLGLLAGAFIAFGAALYIVTMTGTTLGYGPGRLLGGLAFSLGLVLVVIAGAELFTGNNLIVMAWADGDVSNQELVRNWIATYIANAIGALIIALLIFYSGVFHSGGVSVTAIAIAEHKLQLTFLEAFFRGILCNALVCLAIWLSFASRRVAGKILAIIFPVSAFVALGFEHSIANFFLIPVGVMVGADGGVISFIDNIVPVTLGNIVGGAGGVSFVYWVIYRSDS